MPPGLSQIIIIIAIIAGFILVPKLVEQTMKAFYKLKHGRKQFEEEAKKELKDVLNDSKDE